MIQIFIGNSNNQIISITLIVMVICPFLFCSNSPVFEYNESNDYFDGNNTFIQLTPWYFYSIVLDTSLIDINNQKQPIVTLFFKKEPSATNTYKNIGYTNSDFLIEVFIDTNMCSGSRFFGSAKCTVIFNNSQRSYYSDIQSRYYCIDTANTIHAVIYIDSTKFDIPVDALNSDYIWQAEIHQKNGSNLILPEIPFRIKKE